MEALDHTPSTGAALACADEATAALLQWLEHITPEERTAFILGGLFSIGDEELARLMGWRLDQCRAHAHRARAQLRASLPTSALVTRALQALNHPEGTTMSQRLNYMQQSPQLFKKLIEFSTLVQASGLEETIHDLVNIRASQLNGCAFCLDMHIKQAHIRGERELRLHHIAIWRESPLFEPRERAALAWTELLTRIPEQGVSDADYEQARAQFSEKELSDLTFHVMSINAWNRVNVAFQTVPGIHDKAFGLEKAGLA
jgi:AhpD family alkylhydroperoxidase